MNLNVDQYDVVVFDMDGVLLNSNQNKVKAMQYAIDEFHETVRDIFIEYFAHNFGKSRKEHFDKYKTLVKHQFESHFDVEIDKKYSRFCDAAYIDSEVIDEIFTWVSYLHQCNKTLFVATGTPQTYAYQIITQKQLQHYFSDILGSPTSKVDNLRKIQQRAKGQSILFVGDSVHDIQCAQSVGMDFALYAKYSMHDYEHLHNICAKNAYPMLSSDAPQCLIVGYVE